MLYMVNTQTGSSVRLNPCDFALYDQDGDMEVTMKDFDLMFAQMEKDQHRLIEQLFSELDRDHGNCLSVSLAVSIFIMICSPPLCVLSVNLTRKIIK